MPNRSVHVATSGSAGLIWACANVPVQASDTQRASRRCWWFLGGVVGGLLPDGFRSTLPSASPKSGPRRAPGAGGYEYVGTKIGRAHV